MNCTAGSITMKLIIRECCFLIMMHVSKDHAPIALMCSSSKCITEFFKLECLQTTYNIMQHIIKCFIGNKMYVYLGSIYEMSTISVQFWALPMWTIYSEIQLFHLILLCEIDTTCLSSFQNGEICWGNFCQWTKEQMMIKFTCN